MSKVNGIDTVTVLTGPLYERFVGTLPGTSKAHTIPSGYWKIIFIGNSPETGMYASFVMDQGTPKNANFCNYQTNITDIEKRSGLNIWGELPTDTQSTLKVQPGKLPLMIGCD